MKRIVTHLDCTIRDGGYYNNWDFSIELVENYLNAINSLNVNFVEIGYRFFENNGFKGPFAYCTDKFLKDLKIPKDLKIAVMLNGSDLIDNGKFIQKKLNKLVPLDKNRSNVSLIRIACDINQFKLLKDAFTNLKNKGYIVGLNIMKISILSEDEIKEIGSLAKNSSINVLYFADSFGSLNEKEIKKIIFNLKENWRGEIGFHGHDNKGLALINSLNAINLGASWVDSTVLGMGRGAGNAKTEELVLELNKKNINRSYLIPLLKIINNYFYEMKNKYLWGTNSYYYLAAQFSIHPSYIQNLLFEERYKEEDIISIIEYLKNADSTKFTPENLDIAKNFYHGEPKGIADAKDFVLGREVLIIGSGKKLKMYKKGLRDFINIKKPLVIALNEKSEIPDEFINFRVACNPIRLMSDIDTHLKLPQPLITPLSMLPDYIGKKLKNKETIDYGIGISQKGFEFNESFSMIPKTLVLPYALAFAVSGGSKKIFLAGFEGYKSGDGRNTEMNEIIEKFNESNALCDLIAITPTLYYGLNSISLYGYYQ